MELRVLKYFLVTVQEGSITGAANALHLSQPTLSKQLRELEEELGKPLLIRGSRKVTLTEEGILLKKRAEETLKLIEKTKLEIHSIDETLLYGQIVIGSGESHAVHLLTRTMRRIQERHPGVRFQVISGDTDDLVGRLEDGTMDFGLLFEPPDRSRYECLEFPNRDHWGVLMRKDSELADRDSLKLSDLAELPLIVSRQLVSNLQSGDWFGSHYDELHIAGTYSLINNAAMMVEDNLGYAVVLDRIINLTGDCHLCFKPLEDTQEVRLNLVWKKYSEMSKPAVKYLEELKQTIDKEKARLLAIPAERA